MTTALNDHEQLRRDPLLAVLAEKADPTGESQARQRDRGKALAGKSTLNRLLVEIFLEGCSTPPEEIVLDLDATDDPLHGNQEGRFFHGYYGHYCYLPLYVFAGDHLLCARLRGKPASFTKISIVPAAKWACPDKGTSSSR